MKLDLVVWLLLLVRIDYLGLNLFGLLLITRFTALTFRRFTFNFLYLAFVNFFARRHILLLEKRFLGLILTVLHQVLRVLEYRIALVVGSGLRGGLHRLFLKGRLSVAAAVRKLIFWNHHAARLFLYVLL